MEGLSVFLVLVSMFSFLICLVLLIINAIKKKPFKVFGVGIYSYIYLTIKTTIC